VDKALQFMQEHTRAKFITQAKLKAVRIKAIEVCKGQEMERLFKDMVSFRGRQSNVVSEVTSF
jgi:hypothetical protein